jgi:hypothetical protein
MPNHHKRTNAMGAERHHEAQDWQQRQIGKKSPGRHRSGRGEGCHSSHPSQGASKDRHPNSLRPVCGGSAKPRQKDGPERQSGARLAMMPIRREDTAKMGTRSLSPLRGRPLAKTRYFQGSRNRARKRTCHLTGRLWGAAAWTTDVAMARHLARSACRAAESLGG